MSLYEKMVKATVDEMDMVAKYPHAYDDPNNHGATATVLRMVGDAIRLGVSLTPAIKTWCSRLSVERIAGAVGSMAHALAIASPLKPGLERVDSWDVLTLHTRDEAESVRLAVSTLLAHRDLSREGTGLSRLTVCLGIFDRQAMPRVTRRAVARALGDRAGLVVPGWWGERYTGRV